jgi:hypothetical protein
VRHAYGVVFAHKPSDATVAPPIARSMGQPCCRKVAGMFTLASNAPVHHRLLKRTIVDSLEGGTAR